jgi:hypothetical protein
MCGLWRGKCQNALRGFGLLGMQGNIFKNVSTIFSIFQGFFRRALKKLNEYECLRSNNCIIDKRSFSTSFIRQILIISSKMFPQFFR